ncbi:UNVERIFIED_CONTAM: hypothetical protein Slati_1338900 [Sesamum latifolium]|uniref:Uncharacterized protein n=1 Tax=Sesamum latifolium TaxID=2727402 RepID=A0AAW2XJ31_9LAMI
MFGFSVDSHGKSGGLALLWHKHLDVTLQSYSFNHIDASILSGHGSEAWHITGFYGEPNSQKLTETWQLLKRLSSQSTRDWACLGDFNEVLYQHEKSGRLPQSWRQMSEFHKTLKDCFLHDIGYIGDKFTWSNKREWPHTVYARLDRGCASANWSQRFPHAGVTHLPALGFDHSPLILNTEQSYQTGHSRGRRVWSSKAVWLRVDDCEKVVLMLGRLALALTIRNPSLGRLSQKSESVLARLRGVWHRKRLCGNSAAKQNGLRKETAILSSFTLELQLGSEGILSTNLGTTKGAGAIRNLRFSPSFRNIMVLYSNPLIQPRLH